MVTKIKMLKNKICYEDNVTKIEILKKMVVTKIIVVAWIKSAFIELR